MSDNKKAIVEELKHLVRYFQQASHEFFDDTSNELRERLQGIYECLETGRNSIEEYQKMVFELRKFHQSLNQKVVDLGFLTDRMEQLFKKA